MLKNIVITLEYYQALELKMFLEHKYGEQEDIVMSVENAINQISEQLK